MLAGANGLPDPATRAPFVTGATAPVSLKIGPGGDLFYADITGTIYRVRYFSGNQPPIAAIQASPASGTAPLAVIFDGLGSSDPDGDALTYAWDLDGDGQYDDSTAAQPSFTYTQIGSYTAGLRVTDSKGASGAASTTITVGNTPPVAVIDTPAASFTWKVGDTISFSGHATDAQQGSLPNAALAWTVVLHHCYHPGDCHEHLVEELAGAAGGTITAEDHEDLPVFELRLTATDAGGLSSSASVLLHPITTTLALRSSPPNLKIVADTDEYSTPADLTVLAGSTHTLIAPSVQAHRSFVGWADGGAQSPRQITLGASVAQLSATYLNHPPTAALTAGSGATALAVSFDAALSTDPEGDTLNYQWSFGDGTAAAGARPSHSYAAPGSYMVTLTVTDQLGSLASASQLVTVPIGTPGLGLRLWMPLVRRGS
jgi:PKD repeat protein